MHLVALPMTGQNRTAAFTGVFLVVAGFAYAAHLWGIREAVGLLLRIAVIVVYAEVAIYLFAKDRWVLKTLAVVMFPAVVLALCMPVSLRHRVKNLRRLRSPME